MAGKTFPGMGELEDEAPPLDPADAADSSGFSGPYSGPTVVDDVKVEAGLQKLRSLEGFGSVGGITKAVVDAIESGRVTAQVPGSTAPVTARVGGGGGPGGDPTRETALGRSATGPLPDEEPPAFDDRALRGTLFGHSLHLPNIHLPGQEEPTVVSSVPMMTHGDDASEEVTTYRPDRFPPPREAAAYPPNQWQRTATVDTNELTPRGRKIAIRVAIGAAGIAAIVTAAWLWVHTNSDGFSDGTSPPLPAPSASRPPVPPPTSLAAAARPAAIPAAGASSSSQPLRSPGATTKPALAMPKPVGESSARLPTLEIGARDTKHQPPGVAKRPVDPLEGVPLEPRPARHASTPVDDEPPADAHKHHAKAPAARAKHGPEDDPDAILPPSID